MSTQTVEPTPRVAPVTGGFRLPTIDDGPVTGVPFSRLVRVEARKQVDTLAGRWFLITIGLVVATVIGILLFVNGGDHSFMDYLVATSTPLAILLPILGILAATSEWSQRTAMATFALEPRRGRVVGAKVASSLLMSAAAFVVALALAAAGHLAATTFRDASVAWDLNWWLIGGMALMLVVSLLQGVAFGLALLNTPAAIVAYLVLPMVWSMLGALVSWLRDAAAWLDMGMTTAPLTMGEALTGQEWAKVGVSTAVWVGLPLAIGVWRVLRREVK
jgi:hypothetical protein